MTPIVQKLRKITKSSNITTDYGLYNKKLIDNLEVNGYTDTKLNKKIIYFVNKGVYFLLSKRLFFIFLQGFSIV